HPASANDVSASLQAKPWRHSTRVSEFCGRRRNDRSSCWGWHPKITLMAGTLHEFATVNDRAAATSSKLAKQEALAEYFRVLDEADLHLAVRFAVGRPFAATTGQVLGIGGAMMSDAILSVLNITPQSLHELYLGSGDISEAASKGWAAKTV